MRAFFSACSAAAPAAVSMLAIALTSTALSAQSPAPDPSAAGWRPLFDGRTLNGWEQRNGKATYRVEDGAIVGRTAEGSPNSFLCSEGEFADFELSFETRLGDVRLNSGVQIRSRTKGGFRGRVNGPQVEIEATRESGSDSGYIYGEAAGGWRMSRRERVQHPHFKDGEWNRYLVRAEGARLEVWLNGVQVSDVTYPDLFRTHPTGFIGLQVHSIGRGQGPYEVSWRKIAIRPLHRARAGWQDLLSGMLSERWRSRGRWQRGTDGVLRHSPSKSQRGWDRFADYLWSLRAHRDFVLDLEYRYPEGGNSGVFVRVQDRKDPVRRGIEVQILDDAGKAGEPTAHDHGGVIGTSPARARAARPAGEWNAMRVTVHGRRLVVILNGRRVQELEIAEAFAGPGLIGLQDHGHPHRLEVRRCLLKGIEDDT